jgi:hypothetical protein
LIEFRHIKEDLFFGFEVKDGVYIAKPEKAFLDMVYLSAKGKAALDLDELNLKILSKKLTSDYMKKFPSFVYKILKKKRVLI